MAKSRARKTAIATDTMTQEAELPPGATDFDTEEYESAAHAMEASRQREFAAGHHVENGERQKPQEEYAAGYIANPSSTRRDGHADAIGRKEYKKAADPRGSHIIMLSADPKGPKARMLRSNENGAMLIQFTENPGKEITGQLREANFDWKGWIETEFAKGAWVIPLEPGNEWRNHAHTETVFKDVVNQIREKNGVEPFVPGAGQAVA
jgi:hypothetical protein